MLAPAQMQQKVVLKTSLDPICSQKVQVIAVGQAQQLAISVSRAGRNLAVVIATVGGLALAHLWSAGWRLSSW